MWSFFFFPRSSLHQRAVHSIQAAEPIFQVSFLFHFDNYSVVYSKYTLLGLFHLFSMLLTLVVAASFQFSAFFSLNQIIPLLCRRRLFIYVSTTQPLFRLPLIALFLRFLLSSPVSFACEQWWLVDNP